MFSQQFTNNQRTVTGSARVFEDDVTLNCDTTTGAVTIPLMAITANYWSTQYRLYVVDAGNLANVNNITITVPAGFTINGASSITISNNGGSVTITILNNTTYQAVGSGVQASGGGITAIPVNNTVYVMKNGNDSTGLVERFDKPFLTISAARAAALIAFTNRTQTNRVRIVCESGNYSDSIVIDDYIDWDLGNSVITASAGKHCITDNGSVYTACVNGYFTSIIYGNAKFVNNQNNFGGIVINRVNSGNIRLCIYCDNITSGLYECVLMATGYMTLYANYLYMQRNDSNLYQAIDLATDIAYTVLPTLEVYNAKIYTNQTGSINSCIEFSNSNPSLNPGYGKLMLVNCEVGSWSTSRPAINCDAAGVGLGQLTLKNTIIYSASQPSISDDTGAADIIKVFAYNSYANRAAVFNNASSGYQAGTSLNVNTAVIFNQGNIIP